MPSPKQNFFVFYNGPYSGKEEKVLYASSSKNAFLPGTALGSNTGGQGGREMFSLVTSSGCCFCHSRQRASNHSEAAPSLSLSDLLFQVPDWVGISNKPPTVDTYTGSWHQLGTRTTQLQAHSSPRQLTNWTVKLRCQSSYDARGRQQAQTVGPQSSPWFALLKQLWNSNRSRLFLSH